MAKSQTKSPAPAPTPTAAPNVAADKPVVAALASQEFVRLLGEVSWLMTRSPTHKFAFLTDLEWLVMPPLAMGQARLYRNDKGDPIAFASWALVSDEVDQRLTNRNGKLRPADWRSGPHPWIIDLIAPFGGVDEVVKAVFATVFSGKSVPVLSLGGSILDITAGNKVEGRWG